MAGQGSIEKRSANTYRLTVSCGTDSNGNRIRHRKTVTAEGNTDRQKERDALRQLSIFQNEINKGLNGLSHKITFGEFAHHWLEEYVHKQLAPKTISWYTQMLESRILPELGHIKLDHLKPIHIMKFYDILAKDGRQQSKCKDKETENKNRPLSPKTIHHYHEVISSILTKAVKWQYLESNPARRVESPKIEHKEAKHYNVEQARSLLEELEGESYKNRLLIYFALLCEMRRGEIVGLEWKDVDFDRGVLHIRRSVQYVPGEGVITKAPKTTKSRRNISIPPVVLKLLKAYKAQQNMERLKWGSLWQSSDRIFVAKDGSPMFPDTPSKWFKKFLKDRHLPIITFHQLRHTGATLMIAQGVDIRTVSSRLGHSRTSTTLDIYAHALEVQDRQAAEGMESLLFDNDTSTLSR